MAKHDTAKTVRESADAPEPRLSERNRRLLAWLDEHMSTPDTMGDEWWARFREGVAANRLDLQRGEQ